MHSERGSHKSTHGTQNRTTVLRQGRFRRRQREDVSQEGLGRAHGALVRLPVPGERRKGRLLCGTLHVPDRIGDEHSIPERQDPVAQVLHDAPLRHIDLVARPHILPPRCLVAVRRLVAVDQELGGNDESGEDNHLGINRVDVELRCCAHRAGLDRVPLRRPVGRLTRRQGTEKAPVQRELGAQRVQDAHGQGNRVHGQIGANKHLVNQRNRRYRERCRRRDKVDQVNCWTCLPNRLLAS